MTTSPTTPEASYRKERIERLLNELRYEVTRGILDHEIDETIGFQFVVPLSRAIPDGIVHCRFETRPMTNDRLVYYGGTPEPKLRLVGEEDPS